MAFIGPNVFRCPSIFISLLRATGPRCANPFTSHLIPLRVLCTMAALFVVAVHIPFILALILFAGSGVMRSGAVGVTMHLARAVPMMVAPERGGLWKGRAEEREAGAGPRHCSYTFSWRRGPEASGSAPSDCLCSLCAPSPALGRRGAAHPDAAALYDVGTPCRPRAHRTEDSTRAQYRRTARHVAHPRVGAAGAVRQAGEHAHPRLACPLRLRGGSSSTATGTLALETAMAILILTTSATRKKAVREGRRERERARPLFSVPRALQRPSTRAQYRHTAPPAPDGAYEDGRCATSGVNVGAERVHPCDWPARRGYEVGDRAR
ncbi:hypothetical protein B0H13DRAFT_2686637 [Mycena leptocephala]|nr:hypothetical protein B0H13DRAFT_2686637 [Mycena leptocephala]